MAKTYEEWEQQELGKAKVQTDAYTTERRAQAKSAVASSNKVYDAAIANTEKDYAASAKETESGYRSLYDTNAVNELAARRNVEEVMANMGLKNSGMNATEQTAISLIRGRADSQVSRQKRAAVDAIMRELDTLRSKYEADKAAAGRDIYEQADADILNFKNNADTVARQNAASLYTTEQKAAATQYAAEKEAAAAQAAAQYEAAIKQAQMKLDEQKLAYEKGKAQNELIAKYILAGYSEAEARRIVLSKNF